MKQKTQEYVQFIKENHKAFGGGKSGAECAKEMGVSQGRVSQLIKEMRQVEIDGVREKLESDTSGEVMRVDFVNQEATASTAEA